MRTLPIDSVAFASLHQFIVVTDSGHPCMLDVEHSRALAECHVNLNVYARLNVYKTGVCMIDLETLDIYITFIFQRGSIHSLGTEQHRSGSAEPPR
jgi:hypothetical protein